VLPDAALHIVRHRDRSALVRAVATLHGALTSVLRQSALNANGALIEINIGAFERGSFTDSHPTPDHQPHEQRLVFLHDLRSLNDGMEFIVRQCSTNPVVHNLRRLHV